MNNIKTIVISNPRKFPVFLISHLNIFAFGSHFLHRPIRCPDLVIHQDGPVKAATFPATAIQTHMMVDTNSRTARPIVTVTKKKMINASCKIARISSIDYWLIVSLSLLPHLTAFSFLSLPSLVPSYYLSSTILYSYYIVVFTSYIRMSRSYIRMSIC